MQKITEICGRYDIALCYLFGSQKEQGIACLHGVEIEVQDPESDIDFAVLFFTPPKNIVETYAELSLELSELVCPFRADLLFLHEVDHLIQLEAIRGINIFAANEDFKENYELTVMSFPADEIEILKRNEKDFLEAIRDGYFEFEYQAHPG
jgi:uncharacterized protein